MRLRELRDRYDSILERLTVLTNDAGTVLQNEPAKKVGNHASLHAALVELVALDHFAKEANAILALQALGGGGLYAHPASQVAALVQAVSTLSQLVAKVWTTLRTVVPELHGAGGYAIRMPQRAHVGDVKSFVDALEHLDRAVLTLTGERLRFGGFDVGSHWINVVGETVAVWAANKLFDAALTYVKEYREKMRAVESAKAAGIARDDADEVTRTALRVRLDELTAGVVQESQDHQQKRTESRDHSHVRLGIESTAEIIAQGAEIRGLLTSSPDGQESRTPDPEQLDVDGTPLKLLPLRTGDDDDD